MFQPLIIIYRRGNFVDYHWGYISIYRPLSYPFRSLMHKEGDSRQEEGEQGEGRDNIDRVRVWCGYLSKLWQVEGVQQERHKGEYELDSLEQGRQHP